MNSAYRLEVAAAGSLPLLVDWIPDAAAAVRWGGPAMAFPLLPHLARHLDFVAPQLAVPGHLALPGNSWWLTQEGHQLAFGQLFFPEAGRVHLARLIVHPERRGARLGEALVRALVLEAQRQHPVTQATLRVYRDNTRAVNLYQRLGFVDLDTGDTRMAMLSARLPLISG